MADNPYCGPSGISLARSAIDLLQAHGIPSSPENFEIWISYKTGAAPDLNREIDTQIASGGVFTEAFNADLFERHFAKSRLTDQMVETGESIARELAALITSLRGGGAQAGTYSEALEAAAAKFDNGLDPSGFHAVVASLAEATREMAAHNRDLSQQMAATTRRVEDLQASLINTKAEALTDALTGLANRKAFDQTLELRLREAASNGGDLCLLMCDIDHFKRVNDTWGHVIGDQVIRFIAATIAQEIVGDFLAARYGGEEFAIILPRTNLSRAQDLGETIRRTVSARKLTRKATGENLGAVTVSIGVARFRIGEASSVFISRADACLYASKRRGRDSVTTEADGVQPLSNTG